MDKSRAVKMKSELMDNLEVMRSRFSTHDPDYSQDSFDLRHARFVNETMPRLEKQRAEMLSKNWQPNEDWWGSLVVED